MDFWEHQSDMSWRDMINDDASSSSTTTVLSDDVGASRLASSSGRN